MMSGNFYKVTLKNLTVEVRFVQAVDREDAISEAIAIVRSGLADHEPHVISMLWTDRQHETTKEDQ